VVMQTYILDMLMLLERKLPQSILGDFYLGWVCKAGPIKTHYLNLSIADCVCFLWYVNDSVILKIGLCSMMERLKVETRTRQIQKLQMCSRKRPRCSEVKRQIDLSTLLNHAEQYKETHHTQRPQIQLKQIILVCFCGFRSI